MYLKGAFESFRVIGLPCSIIFLNMVVAFACMLRWTIVDYEDGDKSWIRKLVDAGLSKTDIDAIMISVKYHASWNSDAEGDLIADPNVGKNSMCANMSKQLYTNSCMSSEGTPDVMVASMGSMAGTPLADLLFTASISRVMMALRKSFEVDNLKPEISLDGRCHAFNDALFVDDHAISIVSSACGLVSKSTAVACVAYSVLQCCNMGLNFNFGKDECVTHFCSVGKKKANHQLSKDSNISTFQLQNGTTISLAFVKP